MGEILKSLRKRKDVPIAVAAEAIGISPAALSNYERGRIMPFDVAQRMADYYEVSLDELCGKRRVRHFLSLERYTIDNLTDDEIENIVVYMSALKKHKSKEFDIYYNEICRHGKKLLMMAVYGK